MSLCPCNHLVVFARTPRFGTVKRRLAADLGALRALAFYRTQLWSLLRRVGRDRRWTTWLAVTPDRAALRPSHWPAGTRRLPQGPGDLGARMARVMAPPPGGLPRGAVVIIGSDIPGIRPAHIAAAFRTLGRHDVVFGPATDGGYWLVGARRRPVSPQRLFDGVRWSSQHTLADTLANLRPNQTAALIALLDDIDDGNAYARWRNRNAAVRAP